MTWRQFLEMAEAGQPLPSEVQLTTLPEIEAQRHERWGAENPSLEGHMRRTLTAKLRGKKDAREFSCTYFWDQHGDLGFAKRALILGCLFEAWPEITFHLPPDHLWTTSAGKALCTEREKLAAAQQGWTDGWRAKPS